MLGSGCKRATTAAAAATAVAAVVPTAAAVAAPSPAPAGYEQLRNAANAAPATCKHLDVVLGALPTIRPPHELPEWIETDSIDGEVSRLVVAQSGKSRRCCRHSTSSGYSSHSPPLSAASYNGIGPPVGAAAKGLAVIREGEIIPRPIWPSPPDSTGEHTPDTASSDAERDANRQQTSLYGSAGYRSSCEGSGSEYGGPASSMSAREVLLELSRTLSSVLEGDCGKSDEEILRDISRTVAHGAAGAEHLKPRGSVYEEIYRNSSLSSSGKESTSSIAVVNPINSRLYGHRCYCERKSFLCQSHPSSSQQTSPKSDGRKEQCVPSVFLLPDEHTKSFFQGSEKNRTTCNCASYKNECNTTQDKLSSKKNPGKQSRSIGDARGDKDIRFNYPSIVEHEYTTLECSDESSSSEGVAELSVKSNSWCKDFRGFDKNLDFTLDGLRAERLGRAIARAKRRRQWCRVLVVVFGLIFFVLSVVVVSLSVTRGRKVFGSM